MNLRLIPNPVLLLLIVLIIGCATPQAETLYSPKGMLPAVTPDMHTPGYWISRHPTPDTIILDEEGIRQLNAYTRNKLNLISDLSAMPESVPGADLSDELLTTFDALRSKGYTLADGLLPEQDFWVHLKNNLALSDIPDNVVPRYGFISAYTDQRLLPTTEGLFAKVMDIDFDELQNSALDIGTPVIILHESRDGKWMYVRSALSSGWVSRSTVGPVSELEYKRVTAMPDGVVISAKADVYFDNALTLHYGALRMGARLPLVSDNGETAVVLIPALNADNDIVMITGYLASEDIHAGSLPLTARNVITQAFKLLHHPYGWGGMYGAQDCSRYMQEVFATTGIKLPRNSSAQRQVGIRAAEWDDGTDDSTKRKFLVSQIPDGLAMLGMRGHILLYLGTADGIPFAIHAVWAYRSPGSSGDDIFVLNRVVVSDLDLGEGSKKGSLLNRLKEVQLIGLPDGG